MTPLQSVKKKKIANMLLVKMWMSQCMLLINKREREMKNTQDNYTQWKMHFWKAISQMIHCIYKILWKLQDYKMKNILIAHINIKRKRGGNECDSERIVFSCDFQCKFYPITSSSILRHINWLTIGLFHCFPQSQILQ